MVNLLILDIADQDRLFAQRMCECTVALLPSNKERKFATLFHPGIAGDFKFFDKIGERNGRI